ncbi:MAG: hypothetical protein WCH74_08065, partial [Chloroflexota bacterium]
MTEPTKAPRRQNPMLDGATAAALDAVWDIEPPAGDAWTARPWVHPSERAEAGKAARVHIPRVSHA